MDLLTKKQINFVVSKYYKNNHKIKYLKVINELKYYILSSDLSNEDENNFEIGSYLVLRTNGMPPLESI